VGGLSPSSRCPCGLSAVPFYSLRVKPFSRPARSVRQGAEVRSLKVMHATLKFAIQILQRAAGAVSEPQDGGPDLRLTSKLS
jgi:hypothetical protein